MQLTISHTLNLKKRKGKIVQITKCATCYILFHLRKAASWILCVVVCAPLGVMEYFRVKIKKWCSPPRIGSKTCHGVCFILVRYVGIFHGTQIGLKCFGNSIEWLAAGRGRLFMSSDLIVSHMWKDRLGPCKFTRSLWLKTAVEHDKDNDRYKAAEKGTVNGRFNWMYTKQRAIKKHTKLENRENNWHMHQHAQTH